MSITLAASRKAQRRRRPKPEINVTPLVDVMLVLLIIFMVSAPMLNVGVVVNLPTTQAEPLPYDPDIPLMISVNKDGKLFLQKAEVPADQIVPKLKAIMANRDNDRIYVRADAEVPYGMVAMVMGQLSAAGFARVGLVTRPDHGE
ncbi:MAG: protein TolR [Alphaproteobacteria bacterium]